MTNPQTIEEKKHKMDLDHEFRMKLLQVLEKDPELKYYLGIIAGGGIAVLSAWVNEQLGEMGSTWGTGEASTTTEKKHLTSVPHAWEIIAYTSPLRIKSKAIKEWQDAGLMSEIPEPKNLFGFLNNLMTLTAAGFAGYCSMILILKAVFGNQSAPQMFDSIMPG